MADELARAYFEKLKAAEQQIFELQLELAAKNKTNGHATTTVAAGHEALQQRILVLEEDNARLRDAGGDDEQLCDEVEDDEEVQVVMCDCGIDLLAQMQENKALQNELKAERLKFQVIQGQVKNLGKQVSERDEKISNLTTQDVVPIKKEQTDTSSEVPAKRRRTDTENGLPTRPGNNDGLQSMSSAARVDMQHPARAAMNVQNAHPYFAAGYPLPTPAQTPLPLMHDNHFYGAPGPSTNPFAMLAPSFMQQPFVPPQVYSSPQMPFQSTRNAQTSFLIPGDQHAASLTADPLTADQTRTDLFIISGHPHSVHASNTSG